MMTRRLDWTGMHNASCPFARGTCVDGNKAAFTMDTGNISVAQLGINTRSRLSFRRKTTCAPVEMDLFIYPRTKEGKLIGSPEQNQAYLQLPSEVSRLYSFFMKYRDNITLIAYNDTHAGYRLESYPIPGFSANVSSPVEYD